jgi:homogentisate phytyltransferase / homogentisate geranylgeranyltransferase
MAELLTLMAPILAVVSSTYFLHQGYTAASEKHRQEWKAGMNLGIIGFIDAFWRFSRPHTIIGTTVSIFSVSSHAVTSYSEILSDTFWLQGFAVAVAASLLMNVYIVGLNQLTDVEIDRINKPTLPIASGEFSWNFAALIVTSSLLSSLYVGFTMGSSPLQVTLVASMILGTVYSLYPFRLKRFPVFAALCILLVRGVLVQVGFFWHTRAVFGLSFDNAWNVDGFLALPPGLKYAIVFVVLFSVVIALFKDIPDVEGDEKNGIKSFPVRFGVSKVFWLCVVILQFDFVLGILSSTYLTTSWGRWLTVVVHTSVVLAIYLKAAKVDLTNKSSITAFYMFVWKLFYIEYLLFPLMR